MYYLGFMGARWFTWMTLRLTLFFSVTIIVVIIILLLFIRAGVRMSTCIVAQFLQQILMALQFFTSLVPRGGALYLQSMDVDRDGANVGLLNQCTLVMSSKEPNIIMLPIHFDHLQNNWQAPNVTKSTTTSYSASILTCWQVFFMTVDSGSGLWLTLWLCQYIGNLMSNGQTTVEQWTRKDLEGSGYGLIKVQSWHLPGGIEKNHKKLSQDNW